MRAEPAVNGGRQPWWEAVEAKLVALDAVALPDPWADHEAESPALTAAQLAFLVRLDDQPHVPRVAGFALPGGRRSALRPGEGTGNPPGDTTRASSYLPAERRE